MKEQVLCDECCHINEVEVGYYAEQEEETEVARFICESCKTLNSVFWRTEIAYFAHEIKDKVQK